MQLTNNMNQISRFSEIHYVSCLPLADLSAQLLPQDKTFLFPIFILKFSLHFYTFYLKDAGLLQALALLQIHVLCFKFR
jgi:hypothetical protein